MGGRPQPKGVSLGHVGSGEGGVDPLRPGPAGDGHMVVKRGDWAPCLKCRSPVTHSRSRRRPGPGPSPQAFPEEHRFATGTDGPWGAQRQDAYPRSSPRDQISPGRADMGISALLSPILPCLVSSHRNVPAAVPGSARWLALTDGAPWPTGPDVPWPDLPMAWLACSDHPASCVYTWASSTVGGAGGLTPGLSERLAWVRVRGQGPGPPGWTALLSTGVGLTGRRISQSRRGGDSGHQGNC